MSPFWLPDFHQATEVVATNLHAVLSVAGGLVDTCLQKLFWHFLGRSQELGGGLTLPPEFPTLSRSDGNRFRVFCNEPLLLGKRDCAVSIVHASCPWTWSIQIIGFPDRTPWIISVFRVSQQRIHLRAQSSLSVSVRAIRRCYFFRLDCQH